MIKNIGLLILLLFSAFALNIKNISHVINQGYTVYAEGIKEDEEDREDEEDDDDDDYEEYEEYSTETTTIEVPQVIQVPVQKIEYRTVLDAGYDVDTDKDDLVDAIDPDPFTPQSEYFTDSDSDGVPNKFDKFQGINDFAADGNEDLNNNGIIDLYE